MWLLRAVFPFGAILMLFSIALPLAFSGRIDQYIGYIALIVYFIGMFLTFKESAQFSGVFFILIAVYELIAAGCRRLTNFVPQIDFPYADYVYPSVFIIWLIYAAITYTIKRKEKVVSYFHRRQIGSVQDVVKETGLSQKEVIEELNNLLKLGRIEFFLTTKEGTKLFKWTENISFAEGMTSEEIEI